MKKKVHIPLVLHAAIVTIYLIVKLFPYVLTEKHKQKIHKKLITKLFNFRVVSMGGCSLALTLVMYATEALYFRSTTLNFYVIFPCVLNSKTKIVKTTSKI